MARHEKGTHFWSNDFEVDWDILSLKKSWINCEEKLPYGAIALKMDDMYKLVYFSESFVRLCCKAML